MNYSSTCSSKLYFTVQYSVQALSTSGCVYSWWENSNCSTFHMKIQPEIPLTPHAHASASAALLTTRWPYSRTPRTAGPCSSSTPSASSALRRSPPSGYTVRSTYVTGRGSSVSRWALTKSYSGTSRRTPNLLMLFIVLDLISIEHTAINDWIVLKCFTLILTYGQP